MPSRHERHPGGVVGEYVIRVRRKRRSQSRRLRRRRRGLAVFILTIVTVCGGFWLGSYIPSTRSSAVNTQIIFSSASDQSHPNAAPTNTNLPTPSTAGRVVYPYSVVPGGVTSAAELEVAMLHDRVVARHYAGFDFKKARVIELRRARLAYLSYRIGEKIFWTKRLIALHVGEKLITDGKILARARCGNRISTLPQIVTAAAEPKVEEFENPIIEGSSTAQIAFPGTFESELLTRNVPFTFEPHGPMGPEYGPSYWGAAMDFFSPPVPGVCEPVTKPKPKPGAAELMLASSGSKKKKLSPCTPKPPAVPEPGTLLLVASGIGGIYLRFRRKIASPALDPPIA